MWLPDDAGIWLRAHALGAERDIEVKMSNKTLCFTSDNAGTHRCTVKECLMAERRQHACVSVFYFILCNLSAQCFRMLVPAKIYNEIDTFRARHFFSGYA